MFINFFNTKEKYSSFSILLSFLNNFIASHPLTIIFILFVFYMNFRYAFKTFKWAVDKGKASISSKVYIPSISCSKTK